MNTTSLIGTRVDLSPTAALLAVGDFVAIGAFVVAGVVQHGYHPVADAGRVAGTLAPFLAGWLVVALAGSLYTDQAVANVRRTLSWTIPAWVLGVAIALALRATAVFHGGTQPTFALVALGVGGALVVGWRVVATVVLASLGGGVDR